MMGLLALFVIGQWIALVFWLSKAMVTRLFEDPMWRYIAGLLIFSVIFPLPILDEIIGGWQFKKLCQENSTIQVDRGQAKGRTVYFVHRPDVEVKGMWVRIVLKPALFVDAVTKEPVVRFINPAIKYKTVLY